MNIGVFMTTLAGLFFFLYGSGVLLTLTKPTVWWAFILVLFLGVVSVVLGVATLIFVNSF